MFTEMSDASAKNDTANLRSLVNSGISHTIVLILPMAILMAIFSTPIMSLFRAGSFNAADVNNVANVLAC